MSVSINWQPIIGGLLLFPGVALAWFQWWRSRQASQATGKSQPKRKADEPPPSGAVAWVLDICEAMGTAKAESVLAALTSGSTRDQARMARIAELEGAKVAVKAEPKK